MRLFIAEKPSLAKAIVAGLGGNPVRKNGYYEIGDDIVTYCVGHLLEIKKPDEINPIYKKWDINLLPMQLTPLPLQPKADTKSQLDIVASLLKKADVIVNAGDPDDEGQLLVDEVLIHYGFNPDANNVLRVSIKDVNLKPVQAALADLKPNKEFSGMRYTALARSQADYLYGMNLSRAYTLAAQKAGYTGQLSVGRVQTVVFGLIVKRYRQHNAFKGAEFFELYASIKVNGKDVLIKLTPPDGAPVDDKGRIINEQYIKELSVKLNGKSALVKNINETTSFIEPERPLSLLKLQIRMNKLTGMSGDAVLNIVQSLYETHQASSYPRTDNRYMSEAQWEAAEDTLKTISLIAPELQSIITLADPKIKSKAVNDKKLSAHTAIIPVVTSKKSLSEKELPVYVELSKFYIAQFLQQKEVSNVTVEFDVDGLTFTGKTNKVVNAGWSVALTGSVDEDDDISETEDSNLYETLSSLKKDDSLAVNKTSIEKGKTTPPPLYTEASLMNDLPAVRKYVESEEIREIFKQRDKERGGENSGIGTPATRSSILPILKRRGLYELSKKKLVPTKAGEDFFDALPAIIVNPDMTALWSVEQDRIAAGEIKLESFISDIEKFIAEQIEHVRTTSMKIAIYDCPACGKPLRCINGSNGKFWACTGYRDEPQCKTALPDYQGEPDFKGKGKAKTEAKKKKEEKATSCPKCKRKLKRLANKKEEGKFYWACDGVWDKENRCISFYPDEEGKPILKK